MKEKQLYYQLCPEKVISILPTAEILFKHKIKGFSLDNLKEIISIIACHIREDDQWAHLKMTYLKNLVPQGDKYLEGLIDLKVIERSGFYVAGLQSYKYNFKPEYKSRYISSPLCNAKLIRRIERAFVEMHGTSKKKAWGHMEQVKYLKHLTISGDFKKFITSSYLENTAKYNNAYGSATRIQNGNIFFSMDNTGGRFHSNITNLVKELRPFLRISGEELVNIDIRNSQPYLSTIILTNPGKLSHLTTDPAFSMLLQTLKVSESHDVNKYISLAVSGQIYEFLMTEFIEAGLTLTRDETKKHLLRILYARNRMPSNSVNRKARQVFINNFPVVHKIFNKVRGNGMGDKFHSFKRFSILMQRTESYLILDKILKGIKKKLPGTIAVTIHDSIMTGVLTNSAEAVRQIMSEELTAFVGLPPNLRIE